MKAAEQKKLMEKSLCDGRMRIINYCDYETEKEMYGINIGRVLYRSEETHEFGQAELILFQYEVEIKLYENDEYMGGSIGTKQEPNCKLLEKIPNGINLYVDVNNSVFSMSEEQFETIKSYYSNLNPKRCPQEFEDRFNAYLDDSRNKWQEDEILKCFQFDETTGAIDFIIDKTLLPNECYIPNCIGGVKVISIGSFVFSQCENTIEITIPTSVTHIGAFAFSGCENLISIFIFNSVINIGDNAFENCKNVTIFTSEGSYTAKYAKENRIPYELI